VAHLKDQGMHASNTFLELHLSNKAALEDTDAMENQQDQLLHQTEAGSHSSLESCTCEDGLCIWRI
jgi:hypothetical protein